MEDWIYDYGLLDELAVCAYWTERYAECVAACDRLLSEGKLPADKRDRVRKNRDFAVSELQEIAASSAPEIAVSSALESDAFMKLLDAAWQKGELAHPSNEVIAAYVEATPSGAARAKALCEAAHFCRDKGLHDASVQFCEAGFALAPLDEDTLTGLQEEFSIAANYARDPAVRSRGFAACNWLALNRAIPERTRNLAISNLHFYVESAAKMMPSFAARTIGFAAPDGYRPTNPSIARRGDEIVLVQRAVNYTIDHTIPDGDERRYATPDGAPVNTRNFLLRARRRFRNPIVDRNPAACGYAQSRLAASAGVRGSAAVRLARWAVVHRLRARAVARGMVRAGASAHRRSRARAVPA